GQCRTNAKIGLRAWMVLRPFRSRILAYASIIHQGLKFFTRLNPCAVGEVGAGHGFSILRLDRENFQQNRISTNYSQRPLGNDNRSRFCTLPISASRSYTCWTLSSGPMPVSSHKKTAPVARPSSSRIVQTPVFVSPCAIAQCTGAAPRYFGRSEPCRLMQPYWGNSSNHEG